jgi:hypothetical protein
LEGSTPPLALDRNWYEPGSGVPEVGNHHNGKDSCKARHPFNPAELINARVSRVARRFWAVCAAKSYYLAKLAALTKLSSAQALQT